MESTVQLSCLRCPQAGQNNPSTLAIKLLQLRKKGHVNLYQRLLVIPGGPQDGNERDDLLGQVRKDQTAQSARDSLD